MKKFILVIIIVMATLFCSCGTLKEYDNLNEKDDYELNEEYDYDLNEKYLIAYEEGFNDALYEIEMDLRESLRSRYRLEV